MFTDDYRPGAEVCKKLGEFEKGIDDIVSVISCDDDLRYTIKALNTQIDHLQNLLKLSEKVKEAAKNGLAFCVARGCINTTDSDSGYCYTCEVARDL